MSRFQDIFDCHSRYRAFSAVQFQYFLTKCCLLRSSSLHLKSLNLLINQIAQV